MGANALAMKLIIRDKKSVFYLILSTTICYLSLFTLFNTTYLNDINGANMQESFVLGATILTVAFISGYVSWYINIVSMKARRKEIAIQSVSGVTRLGILKISFMQLFVISAISIVLAFTLSLITTPLIIGIVYGIIGSLPPSFLVSIEAIAVTFVIIGLQFIFVFFYNGGMAYRNETIDLFGKEKSLSILKFKPSKILAILSVILSLGAILGIFLPRVSSSLEAASALVSSLDNLSIIGVVGVFKFTLPCIIDFIIDRYYKYDKKKIILLKNIKSNLDNSIFLVIAYILIRFLTSVVLSNKSELESTFALGVIGLIIILIITTVALVYKVASEAFKNKKTCKTMFMLGYKIEEIKSILKIEIVCFCILIVSLPFIQLLISYLVKLSFGGGLGVYDIIYLFSYIIMGIIGNIISYYVYSKIILENLKDRG